jgi:hypothetical protein
MKVPSNVVEMVTTVWANHYTKSELEKLFAAAGFSVKSDAPRLRDLGSDDTRSGALSNFALCRSWFNRLNRSVGIVPTVVLGKALKDYMDEYHPDSHRHVSQESNRDRIVAALSERGLRYELGGQISIGHTDKRFRLGGLYFLLGQSTMDQFFPIPESLVFKQKAKDSDGQSQWRFQSPDSFCDERKAGQRNHPFGYELYLAKDQLFVLADCQRLASRLSTFIRGHRDMCLEIKDMTRMIAGWIYFIVRYADKEALYLTADAVRFIGSDTVGKVKGRKWRFQRVGPDYSNRSFSRTSRSRSGFLQDSELKQIMGIGDLAEEAVRCASRRAAAGMSE